MKKILLTQGMVALVDDEDFERVNQFKWFAHKKGRPFYAERSISRNVKESLHCFIIGAKRADHRNGDGLDNQKHNLRAATQGQNNRAFKRKMAGASSRYRGVYRNAARQKWQCQIRVNGVPHHLGLFESEVSAARAYDVAAREYFGEFAAPNFV